MHVSPLYLAYTCLMGLWLLATLIFVLAVTAPVMAIRSTIVFVKTTIEYTGHTLAFALFGYSPATYLKYEQNGLVIQLVWVPFNGRAQRISNTVYGQTFVSTEAQSRGIRNVFIRFLGYVFIANIAEVKENCAH